MPGYNGTSSTDLNLAIGQQTLTTQSVLDYISGQIVQLTYQPSPTVFMIGTILSYNPVTGSMTVNVTSAFGASGISGPFNTQLWGGDAEILDDWLITLIGGTPAPAATAPVIPSIIVRRLSTAGDPLRGNGFANFLTDIDAVAQIISTRIKLLQGEWFENINAGTPLFQSLLGHSASLQGLVLVMRQRILNTPFVLDIIQFNASYAAAGRQFAFQAVVSTQFGIVTVNT